MSKELARTSVARRRKGYVEGNTIIFPTALREAIPDLPTCAGRVLMLDSINGDASNSALFGPGVQLKLLAKETGRLAGEFTVLIHLQPEAALALDETLRKLASRTW